MLLKDILHDKRCFKLVCGAGNEDLIEIEKLVALYAKAGVRFFDVSAKEEVIKAAIRGIEKVATRDELQNYHLCISIGTKDDPHITKAVIDRSKCNSCGQCKEQCHNKAILHNKNEFRVNDIRCLGCGNCKNACPNEAISFYSQELSLEKTIPVLTQLGISCIELHTTGNDESELYEKWNTINKHFDGILSLSINRSLIGNAKLTEIVKNVVKNREDFSTIIQTDGNPISGNTDDYKTTLQAIATAEIVQDLGLPAFIMLSGGTNSKTTELANLCNINAHGVAMGSFARKIVREYTDREDFFENQEIFNKAVDVAQELVEKTLRDLS